MRIPIALLTTLLVASVGLAADVPTTATPPASTPTSTTPPALTPPTAAQKADTQGTQAVPPVLSLAPADALAVIYAATPADVVKHPMWTVTGVTKNRAAADFLDASAAAFNGPTMVALCGAPWNPTSLRVEFATQPAGGAQAFFEQLQESWVPALRGISSDQGAEVSQMGTTWTIRLPGPVPLTIFAAEKDGFVYGSSRYNDVTAWLGAEAMTARFVGSDDAEKLTAALLASANELVYVNVRGLMPLAEAQLDQAEPGLSRALGLDQLEFAALTLERSDEHVVAQVAFGLAEGSGAAWDLLAPSSAPLEIAAIIPDDYSFFVRGAMVSAADNVDRVNEILAAVDADIVTEFHQECEEFRAEYGFDPLDDFLGNMVDEWIVAARLDAGGEHVFVGATGLAHPTTFDSQISALVRHFKLDIDTIASGATPIYVAPATSNVPMAWAILDDYLIVSDRPQTLVEIVENHGRPENMLTTAAMRAMMRHHPQESAQFVFVNLAPLARMAQKELPDRPETADLAKMLESFSRADAGIGLAVARNEDVVTLRVAAGKDVIQNVNELAWKSLTASVERARDQSKQFVSAANLKGIITGCMIYSNDHKGNWPDSFGQLIQADLVAPATFRSPLDESEEPITAANVDRVSSYLYRVGTKVPADEVVACERELRNGAGNFAFADGHVERIDGPRAEELLAMMKRAAIN